jgi:hypothetical protein
LTLLARASPRGKEKERLNDCVGYLDLRAIPVTGVTCVCDSKGRKTASSILSNRGGELATEFLYFVLAIRRDTTFLRSWRECLRKGTNLHYRRSRK